MRTFTQKISGLFVALALAVGGVVPLHAPAAAAPRKGITKTCPDGTVVKPKQPCPTVTGTVPAFSIADITVNENAGTVSAVILKTGGNSLSSSITYATSNGTATAGSDYTAKSGTVTFTSSQSQATITVSITNDTTDEGDENFHILLTDGTNSTLSDSLGLVTITDDDDTPPPDPTPPPIGGTGDEVAESLEGYTYRTVSDFTYTDALQSVANNHVQGEAAPDNVGAFREICGANTIRYSDHILYYGEEGRSHLHDFNGNKGVNASSTFASLLASGESSCNDMPGTGKAVQRSSYWIPALLDGAGNVRRVNYVSLYYKRRPKSDVLCGQPTGTGLGPIGICTEIPNGLKAIAGMNPSTGVAGPTDIVPTTHTYFLCNTDGKKYQNLVTLAAGSSACGEMSIIVEFPNCWNGTHLWKTDRSHLVYMKNYNTDGKLRCPASNPYLVTTVTVHYAYNLTGLNKSTMKLASDYMNPSQPRGWSLHSDMHIVWDARVKRMFHDNCIDKLFNCSGGDLGNGLQLKGAQQPRYGWQNPDYIQDEPDMPANMVMP